jgi:ribonucleoside-diphosphate reductase alpha chain
LAYEDIYNRVWLPNSPCLVNAGKEKNSGLFACFVAGPGEDDLTVHLETLKDIAQVAKFGGGCGFTGTFIRPKNSPVAGSTHGYSYGPNAYALRISDYMDMLTQAGFRSMALMYCLRSDHKDLDEFIDLKQNVGERLAYNFNQSIMATDDWMAKATNCQKTKEKQQFERLVYNAWNNGEPGLLFHTTINTNTPYQDPIETPNPCGEQLLPEYGSCNLGSINIAHNKFYSKLADGDLWFDYSELKKVVKTITRFLDNVGIQNKFPNHNFERWYQEHRPIGIGLMGYADALLRLELKYGSKNALEFLSIVMQTIYNTAKEVSGELATERGLPIKNQHVNRRNITLVSIAPTGSIGFIADCSHGIEPIFSPVFNRTDERGETYLFEHADKDKPYFRSAINNDPNKVVAWKEHVDTQLATQLYCDSGVSKTVNFPTDATVEEVKEAFIYAWKGGAKGLTVYRDKSRQVQVLVTEEEMDQSCVNGVCDL